MKEAGIAPGFFCSLRARPFLAAPSLCSNLPDMNQPSAESIVRRATAAFNSGRPDEARLLCEKGLARAPGDPMLHHLLAAVLFSKN